jgi:hypothetical protein
MVSDDGSATADASGQFTMANVPLKEGANDLRLQATQSAGIDPQ